MKVMAMAQGTADTVTDKTHSLVSPQPLLHFHPQFCYTTLKHTGSLAWLSFLPILAIFCIKY